MCVALWSLLGNLVFLAWYTIHRLSFDISITDSSLQELFLLSEAQDLAWV